MMTHRVIGQVAGTGGAVSGLDGADAHRGDAARAAIVRGAMSRLEADYAAGRLMWGQFCRGMLNLTEQLVDAEDGL